MANFFNSTLLSQLFTLYSLLFFPSFLPLSLSFQLPALAFQSLVMVFWVVASVAVFLALQIFKFLVENVCQAESEKVVVLLESAY